MSPPRWLRRHRHTARGGAAALGVVLALVLAACGSAPPAQPPVMDDAPASMPRGNDVTLNFESVQRERVAMLEKQGRLADAAVVLEALVLVRPDENRAALADLKRSLDAAAGDRLQRARRESKKGDIDAAEQLYLGVLALQPDQAEAVEALRGIDRTRIRRDYLSRPPRIAFARRPGAATTAAAAAAKADASGADALEVEHASMLGNQGELDDAITMMERRLAGNAADAPARRLLANLHFKKAQLLRATDRSAAASALARCLQLDPTHAGAKALQRQLAGDSGKAAASPARAQAAR